MIKNREYIAITCINSKVEVVKNDILHHLGNVDTCDLSPENFKLPKQPYNPTTRSVTIWEPLAKLDSTMLMANFSDGWLTLAHILGTKYDHELYRFRISTPEKEWPVCSLTYYKNGDELRTIQALKDDPRWAFFVKGEPLEFENLSYYRKRRIKDRFNKAILLEYTEKVGWNLKNNEIWKPNNISYLIKR